MLDVESRLGIDVHDGGAAIAGSSPNAESKRNSQTQSKSRQEKLKKQREKSAKASGALDLHILPDLRASDPPARLMGPQALTMQPQMQDSCRTHPSVVFLLQFLGITAEKVECSAALYT